MTYRHPRGEAPGRDGARPSRREVLASACRAALGGALSTAAGCRPARSPASPAPMLRAVDIEPLVRDADVERLLPALSNWGRWGAQDQRGTLNLIDDSARRRTAALVREGRAVSLARSTALASGVERGAHEVTRRPTGSRDYLAMVYHGFVMTHVDALCHVFADEVRMYNGWPAAAVGPGGASRLGAELLAASGVSGRGVLLDVAAVEGGALRPGTAIQPELLERAEAAHGVRVGAGDLLLVRTGAGERNTRAARSGLHPRCLPWLHARAVALVGGDGDNDVAPLPGFDRWASAMHAAAIPHLGMPLLDNADLEELSRACASLGRWEFLLTIAPLRIAGATGSPVNPIALL